MISSISNNENNSYSLEKFDKTITSTTNDETKIIQKMEMTDENCLDQKRAKADCANKTPITNLKSPSTYTDSTLRNLISDFHTRLFDDTTFDGVFNYFYESTELRKQVLLLPTRIERQKKSCMLKNRYDEVVFLSKSNLRKCEIFDSFINKLTKHNSSNYNQSVISSFLNIQNFNYISMCLRNEEMLNFHLFCQKFSQNVKTIESKTPKNRSYGSLTSYTSVTQRSISKSGISRGNRRSDSEKNKLYAFKNDKDTNKVSSNFYKMWASEDVEITLPKTWKIITTCSGMTILDENKHRISILFRQGSKKDFVHKDRNKKSYKSVMVSNSKGSLKTDTFTKGTHAQNSQDIASQTKAPKGTSDITGTKANSKSYKTIEQKNRERNKTEQSKECLLSLKDPLLLKCFVGKERRQMLMFRFDPLLFPEKGTCAKFSKILENLYNRSKLYEGDPIQIVYNPLKTIKSLKNEERDVDGLILVHSSQARHNLVKACSVTENMLGDKNASNLKSGILAKRAPTRLYDRCARTNYMNAGSNIDQIKSSDSVFKRRHAKCRQDSTASNISTTVETKSNEHSTNDGIFPNEVSKLTVRHKKKFRTFLKQVNVKQIVQSVFFRFFRFYSLVGGHLKSGAVITRNNSNYWLKVSGIVTDSYMLKQASDLFRTIAGAKIVLNVYDYLKFLTVFARTNRLIVSDLVKKMMVRTKSSSSDTKRKLPNTTRMAKKTGRQSEVVEESHFGSSRSLPNLCPNT